MKYKKYLENRHKQRLAYAIYKADQYFRCHLSFGRVSSTSRD